MVFIVLLTLLGGEGGFVRAGFFLNGECFAGGGSAFNDCAGFDLSDGEWALGALIDTVFRIFVSDLPILFGMLVDFLFLIETGFTRDVGSVTLLAG